MRPLLPLRAADRAAGRLRDALVDPARRERNVLVALSVYVVVWALYGTIAKSSQGLHYDMTEVIAWSRDLAWGYKHPPLAAVVAWLWFSVVPLAAWSYYLLAMLMPAIALWFAWRMTADTLDIEKRAAGLALLMLVPFFNFHALKFNVNTVLMPVWAATTFWFLRSYTTRSAHYAALAGVGAAACMLGKYWSVFLLVGLVVAALIDRRRGDYFRSAAPWITVAAGFLVLGPHLVWLVQNDFAPFEYVAISHGAKPFVDVLKGTLGYIAGSIGYLAIPLIVVATIAWRSHAAFGDILWPAERDRRLAAAAFWAPFLLPALGALASSTEITSLWSMPAWTLLPVLLLSSPAVTVLAADTRRILIAVLAVPLAMVLAAPAIAVMAQRSAPQPAAAQAQLLAAEIERVWHEITPLPLRFVGGDAEIAYAVVVASNERPRALSDMPQPSVAELLKSGLVRVCFAPAKGCHTSVEQSSWIEPTRTVVVEITRDFLRIPGRPQRYEISIVPPHEPARSP